MRPNFVLAFLVYASADGGSAFPETPVETLSGKRLDVSRDIAPNLAVLTIGFTKASRAQTSEWSRRLELELARTSGAQFYQVAVLTDVPGLMRGWVIRQIRSSVPKAMHAQFLLVLEREDVWKRLTDFGDPDAAYLILVSHGELVWRSKGRLTETSYQSLVQALGTLTSAHAPREGMT